MISQATPKIQVYDDNPDPADQERLLVLLNEDNRRKSSIVDQSDIAVLLRDPKTAEVVGGLWAEDDFAWVFIKYLVVPEQWRGIGLGARMLEQAEMIARARGRVGLWLNTFDFQSRGFYEKVGFSAFGRLEGTNEQDGQTFLCKRF